MEKILQTFKQLYKGEFAIKKHLMLASLLILPAIMTAVANCMQMFTDKENTAQLGILLIILLIFAVLSIPIFIGLSGLTLKFINGRYKREEGFPKVNAECFIIGFKAIPFYLAWIFYVSVPLICIIGGLIYMLVQATSSSDTLGVIGAFALFIGAIILMYIGIIIYAPFYAHVQIKFAKTFEYSKDLFNPLLPFKYMGMAFKDTMIVCLKYIVVSLIFAFVFQIINLLFGVIGMMFFFVASISNILAIVCYPIGLIIVSIGALISIYGQTMIAFAYMDNLTEINREKIEPLEQDAEKYKDERLDI